MLLALGATPFDQSLRQIAREQGGSASNSMDYFMPVTTMSQLMMDSDYIVHAKVVSANTALTFDDRQTALSAESLAARVLAAGRVAEGLSGFGQGRRTRRHRA